MTDQASPEIEIEILSPRALDISGERFGLLTAMRPCSRSQKGVLWVCKCECGRLALRTAAALRSAVKDGSEPQCSRCLQGLRGGMALEWRERVKERFLLRLERGMPLWTDTDLFAMESQIRADFEERLGVVMDAELLEPPLQPMVGWNETKIRRFRPPSASPVAVAAYDPSRDPVFQEQLSSMLGRAIIAREVEKREEAEVLEHEIARKEISLLHWELRQFIAAHDAVARGVTLPRDLAHAPIARIPFSRTRFGNSVLYATSLEGLASCGHCFTVVLGGTVEQEKHWNGECSPLPTRIDAPMVVHRNFVEAPADLPAMERLLTPLASAVTDSLFVGGVR